jgi:hypothetical protein
MPKTKEDIDKIIKITMQDNSHRLLSDHNNQVSIHSEDLNSNQDQLEILQETTTLSAEDFSMVAFQVSSEKLYYLLILYKYFFFSFFLSSY